MSRIAEDFNRSAFSHFINSPAGRIFRAIAGLGFLVLGFAFRENVLGLVSMVWSFFPLSAGAFDICYMSVLLGGPLSGKRIRSKYNAESRPGSSDEFGSSKKNTL